MKDNLIFLISQPRSGSTLTQKILGSHSMIHTQSEPWIMLHPMNALREDNILASYDTNLQVKALNEFIINLPGNKTEYIQHISSAYYKLYQLILEKNNKTIFLDKTPRYYYIIDELMEYFPNSKVILLWRNPAAVLSSIINTWVTNDLYKLSDFKDDLLLAPKLMIQAQTRYNDNIYSLKYESILKDPDKEIRNLCKHIGLEFEKGMVNYGNIQREKWKYGDQESVYKFIKPEKSFISKWVESLKNPQTWRLVDDYINILGKDIISKMGYDYNKIKTLLQKETPNKNFKINTIELNSLLINIRESLIEKNRLQILLSHSYETINQKTKEILKLNENLNVQLNNIKISNSIIKDKNKVIADQANLISKRNKDIIELKENEIKHKNIVKLYEIKVQEYEELIKEHKLIISKLNNESDILKNQINETERIILEKTNIIDEQNNRLKEKHIEVSRFNEINNKLNNNLSKHNDIVKEQKSIISNTINLILITHKKLTLFKNDLVEQKNNINYLENKLIEKNNNIDYLENELTEKNNNINYLKNEINSYSNLSQDLNATIREKDELIKLIVESYTFRLGNFILKPVKILKQLIRK